jgi:hypothetical protein
MTPTELLLTALWTAYILISLFLIARKHAKAELMIQLASWGAGAALALYGAWQVLQYSGFVFWEGIAFFIMGSSIIIGHIYSEIHGVTGW